MIFPSGCSIHPEADLRHTNKFPKSHRFSVAVKMENAMLEFLRCITVANHRQQKLPLLKAGDEELISLRIYFRLSHDLRFISTKSYEHGIKQIEEIGRMLGGWIKSQSL